MNRILARRALPLVLTAAAVLCVAGDINPPPGPVAPTMKTLKEIEPRTAVQSLSVGPTAVFVIDRPGSYYLADNITGVAGKFGILITASDVTLDLNGFVIEGVPGSLDGICAPGLAPPLRSISVKNGTVAGWGQAGVYLGVSGGIVESIVARNNGDRGILASGNYVVRNCIATENGGQAGIVGASHRVVDCVSKDNSGHGFYGDAASVMAGCVAAQNGADGFHLAVGTPSGKGIVSITGCTSWRNGGIGINLLASGIVKGCVANENGGAGIHACHSLVHSNTAVDNTGSNIDDCGGTSTLVENHAP